jgi:hypothetical protein
MPQTTEQHFRAVAPAYMRLLLTDFPELGVEDAAAVFGNAGQESRGLTDDQEDAPTEYEPPLAGSNIRHPEYRD